MICEICKSEKLKFLTNIERINYEHKITICKQCGLIQTKPQPTTKEIKTFYEEKYRATYAPIWNKQRFYDNQKIRGKKILQFLSEKLNFSKHKKVLEIGSSYGGILKTFKLFGFLVTGVEINRKARVYAENKGIITYKNIPKQRFDLVILNHVLEHLTNPKNFLVRLQKNLTFESLVYIDVPNFYSAKSLKLFFQYPHLYSFTPTTIINLVESAGYKVVFQIGTKLILSKNDSFKTKNFKSDYTTAKNYFFANKQSKFFLETKFLLSRIIVLSLKKLFKEVD